MTQTIVLKNKLGTDVTFTRVGASGNSVIFDNASPTLIGRKRITLALNDNKNTNRISVKLSLPSVCTGESGCSVPTILYTQVASADITVVKFASTVDREDLAAMFASLTANAVVSDMVNSGVIV